VSTSDDQFARFVENGCAEHRPVTIDDHQQFREAIASPRPFDAIDELVDELTVVDPYGGDPPNRRSDKEISRVLRLLDELDTERGKH
jgi:hypothetical protein